MKKLLDKLLNNIKFDKRYVLFCLIIVILGIITGSVFIIILNNTDKTLVIEYIQSFVGNLKNNNINCLNTFTNTLTINYLMIFIILIIGLTYFLVPINILILFYKAFIIGFSLSSFILTYKLKGLLLSFVYIFPHLIINILIILLLTSYTLKLSLKMINNIINKKEINIRKYFNKYIYVLVLFTLLITITSLYESFVCPCILKLISKII